MGRQTFVYQGQEYDLPDTYTPDQAKARILEHLGQTASAPVQQQTVTTPQAKAPELSPWESFKRSYGEELFGAPERGKAYIEMQKYKPGTPQYKTAEQALLAKAPQRGEGIAGGIGSALGGTLQALQELNPFGGTYGGIRTPQAAEEYIRRAQQQPQETPQQRLAKASEYGQASYLGNVLGVGVGGAATRLGTAAKQGIAGTVAGRVADVGAGKQITPADVGTDFLINAALGGLTHTTPASVKQAAQADIEAAARRKAQDDMVFQAQLEASQKEAAQRSAEMMQQRQQAELARQQQEVLAQKQAQADALAQRAQPMQQQELFGSYAPIEDIGYQRQLAEQEASGQLPMDFTSPVHEIGFKSPIINLKRKGPAPNKIVPGVTLESPLRFQERYKEQYGLALPEETQLPSGTQVSMLQQQAKELPMGDLFAQEAKAIEQAKPTIPKKVTESPLSLVGAEESPAILKNDLTTVIDQTKAMNNGNLPDIKSNINKWMMPTNQFLKYENNPILSYGIHKADQIKANVRDVFQEKVFGEHMKGATPKFGNTGAAAMFKLPRKELEDLLEKTRPYWNKDTPVDFESLKLTERQRNAWEEYRKASDWILEEQNKRRAELGMEPISKEANYMPRMRLGDFTVIAKDKTGNLAHYSAYPDIVRAKLAAQQLKKQGYSVETPMKGQVVMGGTNAIMHGPESFSKHQQMVAGARAMEAADVPGFAGDLKPKEMIDALHQYFSQAQRDLVGLELRKLDRELNGNVPPKVYAKVMEHMDKQVGLNYLHSPDWLRDIAKGITKYSGGLIKPAQQLSTANRAFMIYKVLWSPVQLAQALIAPMQMVNPHIASLAQEGVNGNALRRDLAETTIRMLAGKLKPDEVNISSKALRSGYLANIRELGELQAQLSGHKTLGALKEFLQDPFMSSKVDLANRQAYFLAGYNHLKSLGKSSDEAFHTAGRWTKEAYIDVSPEGKAPWVSQMGPASSIMGGLSTYSTGMASQLINYIKMARDKQAAAPVLLALTAALVAGGLRGMPGMGTGEALTSAWNKMFPESSISGPDDFLMEMSQKYPAVKDLIHGVISNRLGVDWSRSFGLPGPTEAIPAVGALMEGKLPATLTGLGGMTKGAYDLAQEQLGNKVLAPREKEQAIQQVLPRGLQKIHYGQDVLDQQSNLLGTVSPEAQKIAAMTGSRSLEEAQLRSKEHRIKQQSQQISAQAKQADTGLSKALLYGNTQQQDAAFNHWLDTYVQLAPKGKEPNIDNVVNDLVDRVIGSSTLPEERDMLKDRVTELLLRQGYADQQKD